MSRLSLMLTILLALDGGCAGLGSVFPPDAGAGGGDDDAQDSDTAPLFPLRAGIELTYDAVVGYGDVTATGTLVESHVGMVDDDGQDYFVVEREFVASEAGAEDPAGYGFVEQRYFRLEGGAIALRKGVVTYPNGLVATSTYSPADLRFDRKATIALDHSWSTLGQVAIVTEVDGTREEQTLDHRSDYQVAAAEDRAFLDGTRSGFTITGTHHYGDSVVEVESFCAPDLAIGYQAIVPSGQVGRPVTQELVAVQGI